MNKRIRVLVAGLLTATIFVAPVASIAQDKTEKPKTPATGNATERPTPATRGLPFRGKVAAVDKEAKSVKVGEQVLHISPETKLTKDNQTITVADIAVGDAIAGNYTKGDDGKLTARMMRVGAKPSAAEPADKKANATEKKAKPADQ